MEVDKKHSLFTANSNELFHSVPNERQVGDPLDPEIEVDRYKIQTEVFAKVLLGQRVSDRVLSDIESAHEETEEEIASLLAKMSPDARQRYLENLKKR